MADSKNGFNAVVKIIGQPHKSAEEHHYVPHQAAYTAPSAVYTSPHRPSYAGAGVDIRSSFGNAGRGLYYA